MSDIHALSGAYAIDALEQFERVQFERHMAECDVCRTEVDSLREAAALMAESVAVTPPADLRARVLADIDAVRPLPPLTSPSSLAERRRPRRLGALVAAAAAVLVVGGGGVALSQLGSDDSPSAPSVELSAVDRVLQAPDAELYSEAARGGGTVTVVRSKSLNKAVVTTEGLAAAPSGHTHELWLQHDNVMIPAGYLSGGDQQVVLDGDAASAQGFGLTIEPATGSREPSDKIVALLDFQSV